MFDPGSRYLNLPTATLTTTGPDGTAQEIRYVRRRFIPSQAGTVTLLEHEVTQGDRLDNIAARYAGDPLLFWRICDANGAARPSDLTDDSRIGYPIRIALSLG
jgi:hypothetical protein